MAFSFKEPKKKESLVAIFDIGSGSVGGAIVRMPTLGDGLPTIITSARTEITTADISNFDQFVSDMQKALDTTAELLSTSKVGAPDNIVAVLASPWYISETRVVKYAKDSPFVFTKRIAEELYQSEAESLKPVFQKKYNSDSTSEIIEHHVMGIALNGYAVYDPMGKRTREVEMNMLISISPKDFLSTISKVIAGHFPHLPVSFSSFTLSSFIAVRDRFVAPDSYLLLDVGGEVTDVAIVTKGVLSASLSFPFGQKTFFRYISTKLSIEERDAIELFKLYTTDNLAPRRKKKVEPLFKLIENDWGEAFRSAIGTLPHTLALPNTVFLTADINIRDWFANLIRTEPYISSIAHGNTCTVVTLEGPELLSMCSVKDSTCDPFLMIEAIGVMRKTI